MTFLLLYTRLHNFARRNFSFIGILSGGISGKKHIFFAFSEKWLKETEILLFF